MVQDPIGNSPRGRGVLVAIFYRGVEHVHVLLMAGPTQATQTLQPLKLRIIKRIVIVIFLNGAPFLIQLLTC